MKPSQAGFSIIEVMLAIALGMLLLVSISKIYLSMKVAYKEQTAIARLQENGRLASYILRRNIAIVGYSGCRPGRLADSLQGYSGGRMPDYLRGRASTGSDIVVVKAAATAITHLTRNISGTTSTIYVKKNPATKSQRQLLISDCEQAQLFSATNTAKRSIRANIILKHHYYKSDTEIARVTDTAYFIGKTSRMNSHDKPIFALYSVTNKGRKQELVDGIEKMQIQYIVNSSYYSAAQVTNWNKVQAVYITLELNYGAKIKPWKLYISLEENRAQS